MVQMSGSGPGYMHRIIVTPYMHILIYHMLRKHGSLMQFSGQGITNWLLVATNALYVLYNNANTVNIFVEKVPKIFHTTRPFAQ